jgi:type VI secretion system protein ImpH
LAGVADLSPDLSARSLRRTEALGRLLDALSMAPQQFDFFQAMRRLEHLSGGVAGRPRFGAASRPAEEPIRIGQEPSLAFSPAALDSLQPGRQGFPPRLMVNFFGLLGPNGPLPLHLTEYARDRARNSGDATMRSFLDLFHHRMMMFFYRAWSSAEPTVSHDRPETNRFIAYVGSLIGIGLPSLRGRDRFPDAAKLFYAGRFSTQTRNAEGLAAVIGDFFRMPARIEPFVGESLDIPAELQWALGRIGPNKIGLLGVSTTLGARAWGRQSKFRVVLGPLDRRQFQSMLPGGDSLPTLNDLVRSYAGDDLRWDLRLFLEEKVEEPLRLQHSRLGWTSWLGRAKAERREDLLLDPQAENYRKSA